MGAFDLQNAHEADSRLVKSQIRNVMRAAMDPSNFNYMITSIKLDFFNGPLLTGNDPRYVYRSPEMTIQAIPVSTVPPEFYEEVEIEPSQQSEAEASVRLQDVEKWATKAAAQTKAGGVADLNKKETPL